MRPQGKHDAGRSAVHHGSEDGAVAFGGRRVGYAPRGQAQRRRRLPGIGPKSAGNVPVPAYELFSSTEPLGDLPLAKMMAKLSTRRCRAGLELVGTEVEARARSTSKSAASRRFDEATKVALTELLATDLSGLALVALMVDAVHFADHPFLVALGIGSMTSTGLWL